MNFSDVQKNDNHKEGGNNTDQIYYGTTSDAYDIRYQDDCHQTYGRSYGYDEEEK